LSSIHISVIGDNDVAGQLAKKGTESDITLYNYKKLDVMLNYWVPSRYPERLRSLLYCAHAAHYGLLFIDQVDKALGEIVVALDLAGPAAGTIFLRNYLLPEQVRPILANTRLSGYDIEEWNDVAIREKLSALAPAPDDGPPIIELDQGFPVKGVGYVVLGTVKRGTVRKHDKLAAYPLGKQVLVRSIQVHDVDVEEAGYGSRVGLALKSQDPEGIDRGVVLAPVDTLQQFEGLETTISTTPYWKTGPQLGTIIHVSKGMQFIPARVAESSETGERTYSVKLELDRPLVASKGDTFVACQLESVPRVVGKGTV